MLSFEGILEPEIEDPEEETFFLYSQPLPSQNLGFVDPKARSLQITIADKDYTIHQSPAVLSSDRAGGTTGAVLWKITPLFASWLSKPNNFLFGSSSSSSSSINAESSILELGCGISPLNAFALAPRVDRYILSDQPYVQRLIQQNLDDNEHLFTHSQKQQKLGKKKGAKSTATISSTSTSSNNGSSNISFTTLDWETESPTPALTGNTAQTRSFDAVLACDCVFNYALVQPFVQTCADVCKLRTQEEDESKPPTLCIVAQQLRNDEVFLSWLQTFYQLFRVWRVPDTMLPDGLQSKDGFVVHIGVLRESSIPQ